MVARFRPLTAREAGARCVAFDAAAEAQVSVTAGGAEASCVPFAFDAVLRESATQSDVYDTVARQTVERVQQGFNGAILAFGQSGSGKTFTMGSAPSTTPAARGLIPRIAAQLLADGADVLTLSLVEVYKERIRARTRRPATASRASTNSAAGRRVRAPQATSCAPRATTCSCTRARAARSWATPPRCVVGTARCSPQSHALHARRR